MAVIFIVVRPAYKYVSRSLLSLENHYLNLFTEKTGLTLQYESLSPSVLTGLRFKGVVVKDVESGDEIFSVKKVSVSYNIFNLLHGDLEHTFTNVQISDVRFDYNIDKYRLINEKISALIPPSQEENSVDEELLISKDVMQTLEQVFFSLPFDVQVKNIGVGFASSAFSLETFVKEINFQKKRASSLSSGIEGYVVFSMSSFDNKKIGAAYKIDGTLLNVVSGSSLKIILDEYPFADITLNKTQFLLRYEDELFTFQTIQRILPYNISLELGNRSAELNLNVLMRELNPVRLIKAPGYSSLLKDLDGTLLSCDISLDANLRSLEYSWKGDVSCNLSKNITPSGQYVRLNAHGNTENIFVDSLTADGQIVSGSLYGSYNIPSIKPNAVLLLEHFTMPNGGVISGELYADPLENGFMCFIPEVSFNEQKLSEIALNFYPKKNNIDFDFSLMDLSHSDFDVGGRINLNGSFGLGTNQELQTSVEIDSLFLDSVLNIASCFIDTEENKTLGSLAASLQPFITSMEFYLSTDFKSVTFNSPYSVFANTKEERQMLVLSFDGTEQSLQVTQFDLLYGKQNVSASLEADYSPEYGQALINMRLNVNKIPYELNGVYNIGKWLSLTGDYGFDVTANLENTIEGSVEFSSFPVSVSDYIFSFSFDSSFKYSSLRDFSVDIKNFEAEELSGLIITKPKFALKGSVDPEGVLLSDVSFSDTVSALSGSGYALLNVKNSIFDSANLDLILSNPLNSESVSVNASVTNPMGEDFSGEHLTEDFFFNAEVNVNQLELSHVLENQHSDDTLTALVTASGTIENPYVSLSISSFSMQAGGMPLLASGDAAILENKISVSDFRALWNGFEVKKINADIDIASFNGSANANLNFAMGDKILEAPFNVLLTNLSGEGSSNGFPEFYSLELSIPKLEGNIFTEDFPISASVIRSPGRFDIMTDENLGAYGELLDDGSLNFTVDSSKPLHFELGGKLSGNVMDLHLDNVYLDVSRFAYIINSDFFTIYNGVVTGSAEITGLANDPGIDGAIVVSDLDLNLPSFVPEHITAKELFVEMIQNEIQIPETVFNIQDTNFAASAFFSLDRLTFGVMEVNLETSSKKGIPIDVRIPLLRIRGNASAKATLLMQDNSLDLSGDIGLNNTDIILIDNFLSLLNNEQESVGSQNSQAVPMGMNIDLNLLVGQKVQVELNPILRGIIAPNTNVAFTFDSSADLWTLKGDVVLRGGEVSYLSRNFYLKEGRIIMNENQGSFNPMVTFRAETREHDSAGNPVTITLSAIRQNVANFHPSLYATPAKSENEIMSILGQIATGDSSSVGEIAVAAGDYLVQAAVFRKIEGALRDLGNFDIFSIRNSFFQNTVKNGLNLDNNNEVLGKVFSNFFDNSTVYIGKYFGDTIYAEALMHWSYSGSDQSISEFDGKDIVFQPEIGFELAAPFANIRLDSVFDLDLSQIGNRSFIPDTSLTLSWRLTF